MEMKFNKYNLDENFFEENISKISILTHQMSFFEEIFHAQNYDINTSLTKEDLNKYLNDFLSVDTKMIDQDLQEELINRVINDKKRNLNMREYIKVLIEAETLLLMKIEYLKFLILKNDEIINNLFENLKSLNEAIINKLEIENNSNFFNLEMNTINNMENLNIELGFKSNFFLLIKYNDYEIKTDVFSINENKLSHNSKFKIEELDSFLYFKLMERDSSNNLKKIAECQLSLLYLNFLQNNVIDISLNNSKNNKTLINLTIDFDLKNFPFFIDEVSKKFQELETEKMNMIEEKIKIINQLKLLMEPWLLKKSLGIDVIEYYNLEKSSHNKEKSSNIYFNNNNKIKSPTKINTTSILKNNDNNLSNNYKNIADLYNSGPREIKLTSKIHYENQNSIITKESKIKKNSELKEIDYSNNNVIQKKLISIINHSQNEGSHVENNKIFENSKIKSILIRTDLFCFVYLFFAIIISFKKNLLIDITIPIGVLVSIYRNKFIMDKKRLIFFIILTFFSIISDIIWFILFTQIWIDEKYFEDNGNEYALRLISFIFSIVLILFKGFFLNSLFLLNSAENLAKLTELILGSK